MVIPDAERHRGRARPPAARARVPLRQLLRVASVACGIQFGWALQLSLLTPYVQELGIPHAWASVIWLCGPLSGLVVQPLVGHMSDRCTSRFGRRRPFIAAGAASIAISVLIIGHAADIGWLLGDRGGDVRPRAIAVFVFGFWILDVANNMTQGPCRALLADLTGMHVCIFFLYLLLYLFVFYNSFYKRIGGLRPLIACHIFTRILLFYLLIALCKLIKIAVKF